MGQFTGVLQVPAGLPVHELETPTLVVDLDAMERNIQRMVALAARHGVHWRAHAKMHKCAALAKQLIDAGSRGCCVQKISEAEAMAAGGIDDIFISNEIVSASKLARAAQLAIALRQRGGQLAIAVDSLQGLQALASSVQQATSNLPDTGPMVDVLVELNVGQNRAGVATPQAVVVLAQAIAQQAGLRFAGLHAYHGGAQHIEEATARQQTMAAVYALVKQTIDALQGVGFSGFTVTGAGSGTCALEAASGLYSELQPGSFALMDAHYTRVESTVGQPAFEPALFVKTQVISRAAGHAVVDAGHKSHAIDSGLPLVWNAGQPPTLVFGNGGDEHGLIHAQPGAVLPELGQALWLVPGHCDPTINLHDAMVGVRGGLTQGVVERLLRIDARGAIW
ncbi:DSD1 family PLP-dependent enzyme [Lampropedia aestuarii]|uniref:DSD1 family PLP-dependent enzyme n=1 Tax=Lampropedia aestuarii TaxID=2562762 RepID=A0A4S5BRY4_9BURK|nr:DSD1 family PLP-dependent enzyme [Lampropedia aestuarii]THJ35169.1 DSD1 family PLP-dependent enzyme [Lampropedia aestuarii]